MDKNTNFVGKVNNTHKQLFIEKVKKCINAHLNFFLVGRMEN